MRSIEVFLKKPVNTSAFCQMAFDPLLCSMFYFFQIFVVMGLVTTSDSLVNLDEAFGRPPELIVYISQFETFLIDVRAILL